MTSKTILTIIAITFLAGTITSSTLTAVATSSRSPFDQLHDEINHLQDEINNISLLPGPQGPVGPQGPQGATGPAGTGSSVTYYFATNSISIAPGAFGTGIALCHSGDSVTGGGYSLGGLRGDIPFNTFYYSPPDKGWMVSINNAPTSPGPGTLTVNAICAHQGP